MKGYPDGLPWDNEPGKARVPNGRNAFIFMCKKEDFVRSKNLLIEAKEREIWKDYWGPYAFTVRMPNRDLKDDDPRKFEDGEKTRYIQCNQAHGSTQLSFGNATIHGLYNAEKNSLFAGSQDLMGRHVSPRRSQSRKLCVP